MNQTVQNTKGLYTPGSRFISGDLDRKQDKNYENQPIPPEEQEYYFAIAVRKDHPEFQALWETLYGIAYQFYASNPQILAQIQLGLGNPASNFSWKIDDGDAVKVDPQTGQPKPPNEHEAGCWIIRFRSKYDFGCCDPNNVDIPKSGIKRGDYIDVMFTAGPNGRHDANAGIKIYPDAVRLLGYGDAISGAVAASTAFSGRAAAQMGSQTPTAAGNPAATPPAGAMPPAQPPATTMPPAAGMPPAQPAPAQPMGAPAPQPTTAPQPMGQPAPAPMPNAAAPQPMGNPAPQAGAMMPPATGGMPPAQPGMATTSPTEAGVPPHPGILAGPHG